MRINLKKNVDDSYDLVIGKGLDTRIIKEIKKFPYNRYIIITDSNVKKLYADKFCKKLIKNKIKAQVISFKAGEKSKTLQTHEDITKKLFTLGLDRKSCIIALGGGVVGDIAGFAAGTYMRGIPFIQIPTTLLAMVDSSIGGKTGVNLPKGKNIVGLFNQPKRVYIDINYLSTLSKLEFYNGITEMVKHAIVMDRNYFEYLEKNLKHLYNLKKPVLIKAIKRSCEIKANVVEKDEKEKSYRMVLNLGHTFGHALEAASNYKMPHGEAVAFGIFFEAKLAKKLKLLNDDDYFSIIYLLSLAKVETKTHRSTHFTSKKVLEFIKKDKKAESGNIKFVLPNSIGKVVIRNNIDSNLIKDILYKD